MADELTPIPPGRPRRTSDVVARSAACRPLRDLYDWAAGENVTSWNQVEERFLQAMGEFDSTLAATATAPDPDALDNLVADLQNGKGDFFNDLLALLLEGCSGIEDLYARARVPVLLVEVHNLDGVYPPTGEVGFLLEAKMMGTPKHALNRKQKDPKGRRGSADIGKRVKELAFKSIDLKGEASRRRTILGGHPTEGGAGGGDLTTWLRSSDPKIYFFLAARVISDSDFRAVVKWCGAAAQVVDAVGLYCYEPGGAENTSYRRRDGIPPELTLERTLYKACLDLQQLEARTTDAGR